MAGRPRPGEEINNEVTIAGKGMDKSCENVDALGSSKTFTSMSSSRAVDAVRRSR
ncbi:hypothetical protein MA5S0422_0760 [Mycobacteroides abscessus 5S-0422]|uniref:Uncharacterized protein n=1 Tax=Mycobacteroides abscessus subsp. bolletii 1513 TaxID=1299321 RepID=X8E362_9MYCO|nr:hypothetical protein MA5S0304_5350 [Mycobacteroides abscessus 5S-0304]EIU16999.1 hypothetical protein MA5S0421_0158 [Mycobacteroides abscessus 5S-0421]EIU18986.1 hypothetical protein MA5S0422_0760 [Mycobacteroides abscessus 5S-0422]EIU24702.1 hypothetical protein MA5S0817_4904 [Mycobacteroides abscessus 5S-0817]EIU32510.1 hypothetical protein MA5S0708_0668 [Mycobacteroides abscessus 5S-0708]EIU35578.1 hypothetical protein MA5S1212_0340 [Mycobacteroides abscessus 5S-1212]EIU42123.1 hypothet